MLRVTTFRLVTVKRKPMEMGVKLHISIKLKENKAHDCKYWNYTENTLIIGITMCIVVEN